MPGTNKDTVTECGETGKRDSDAINLQQVLESSGCFISQEETSDAGYKAGAGERRPGESTTKRANVGVVARQALALPSRRTGERKCLCPGCRYFPELSLLLIEQCLSALFVVFARTSF
jgi:hypothetical protein